MENTESFQPEIIIIYCGNSLINGEYLSEGLKQGDGFQVRFVMTPCSCKVETGYLVKLAEEGADGVMLIVCPKIECQYMNGSTKAIQRVRYAQRLLEETGMEPDRIAAREGHLLSAYDFVGIAADHADGVRPLGPNAMKLVAV